MATKKKKKGPVMKVSTNVVPEFGKVFVWSLKTGQKYERWPVDAREMTKRWPEDWSSQDPEGGEDAPDTLAPVPLQGQQPVVPDPKAEHSPGVPLNTAGEAGEAKALEMPPTPKEAQQKG